MNYVATAVLAGLVALPASAQEWKEDYQTIGFGVLSSENEQDQLAQYEPYQEYLERELGVEIEMFTAGSYDGVVQALAADQIEFADFGSSSYAAAYTATNGGVVPMVADVSKDGSSGYYSIVVVRCDSGYESLADLEGKVHAFADPDSTSGYAVPYFNFVDMGMDPTEYFADIPFSGSHEAGVLGVVNGTFDSASTYQNTEVDGVYQNMENKDMIEPGQVCAIWESPEITNGPTSARANLPDGLIEAMTAATIAFPEKDPEGFRAFTRFSPEDPNPTVGYKRVDHDRYQWIVDMRDWLKRERRGG